MTQPHHATMLDACTAALANMEMMREAAESRENLYGGQGDTYRSYVARNRKEAIAECIAALKSEMEAVKLPVDK